MCTCLTYIFTIGLGSVMKKGKFTFVIALNVFEDIITTLTKIGLNPKPSKMAHIELLATYPFVLYFNLFSLQNNNETKQFNDKVTQYYRHMTSTNRKNGYMKGSVKDYELVPFKILENDDAIITQDLKTVVVTFGTYASSHYRMLLKKDVRIKTKYFLPLGNDIEKSKTLSTKPDLFCTIDNKPCVPGFLQSKDTYKNSLDIQMLQRNYQLQNQALQQSNDVRQQQQKQLEELQGKAQRSLDISDSDTDSSSDSDSDSDSDSIMESTPLKRLKTRLSTSTRTSTVGRVQNTPTRSSPAGRRKNASTTSTRKRKADSSTNPEKLEEHGKKEKIIRKQKQKQHKLLCDLELITYDFGKPLHKTLKEMRTTIFTQQQCFAVLLSSLENSQKVLDFIQKHKKKLSKYASEGKYKIIVHT